MVKNDRKSSPFAIPTSQPQHRCNGVTMPTGPVLWWPKAPPLTASGRKGSEGTPSALKRLAAILARVMQLFAARHSAPEAPALLRTQPRPCAGAAALWDDIQALAALSSVLGTDPASNRTRTQGAPPDPRRTASACQ